MGKSKISNLDINNNILPLPFESVEYQINKKLIIPSMELRELTIEKYKNDGLKILEHYLKHPYLGAPTLAIEIETYISSRLKKEN